MNALDHHRRDVLYLHNDNMHPLPSNILQKDTFYKLYNRILDHFNLSILSLNFQLRLYSFHLER